MITLVLTVEQMSVLQTALGQLDPTGVFMKMIPPWGSLIEAIRQAAGDYQQSQMADAAEKSSEEA